MCDSGRSCFTYKKLSAWSVFFIKRRDYYYIKKSEQMSTISISIVKEWRDLKKQIKLQDDNSISFMSDLIRLTAFNNRKNIEPCIKTEEEFNSMFYEWEDEIDRNQKKYLE